MKKLLLIAVLAMAMSGCADVQPQVKEYTTGHEYGFWGGLWHGCIAPISFFGKIFTDDIDVYAINNNGNWYAFGFVLGIGALGSSTYKSSRR